MKLDPARMLRETSIAQQVMVLLVVALGIALAINIAIIALAPPPPRQIIDLGRVIVRLQTIYPDIRAAPPQKRSALAERGGDRAIRFELTATPPPPGDNPLAKAMEARVAQQLRLPADWVRSNAASSPGFIRSIVNQTGPIKPQIIDQVSMSVRNQVAVRVDRSHWLLTRPPTRPEERLWLNFVGFWFLASAALMTPLALWFANRMAAPIRQFAVAAERLGRDPDAPPLLEIGPREVRSAAQSFNTMRERIRRFVADRTLMLAAISHDLRTPLQRMRFRVDALPEDVGQAILADIEEMEAMLSSTLAFARDDAAHSPREPLDLGALVESVCDDAADAGGAATCAVSGRVVVSGDSVRVKRAIANLVGNAIKYAGAAEVSVRREGLSAIVEVADRGPGIPAELREEVFQPFRRLEPSRSKATGGVGLGLAIARTIARAHGGDVCLNGREGGGLAARLALPL